MGRGQCTQLPVYSLGPVLLCSGLCSTMGTIKYVTGWYKHHRIECLGPEYRPPVWKDPIAVSKPFDVARWFMERKPVCHFPNLRCYGKPML